ncbi:methyltransferase domain-containing protein [Streptomyces varsoviensis]|uniref:methyltransferase domain-containing protein n=1 Tax=Streptomyces varsoviensis TaxID=67373 RepID=UPI003410E0B3
MSALLLDVVRHTGSPRLTALVPAVTSSTTRLRPLLEELRSANQAPCVGAYLDGSVDSGYRAVQEEVLTQELLALARLVGPPAATLRLVLAELALLRARQTALACWLRFGEPLRSLVPTRPDVVSIGAGLGEFEGTLVRETAARALCVDIQNDADAEPSRRPQGLRRRRITPLEAYRPLGADLDLLILKDALHHMRQPQWLLWSAVRALRPGGVALVMEPTVEAADRAGLGALRELDSTPYKNSIVPAALWERWYGHAGLTVLKRLDYPPGIIDNNDSFPRTVWLLGQDRGPGRMA